MLVGLIFLVVGIALVLWGADTFTDGAVLTARRFGMSTFYVGAVVSGFEPENLVTGGAAALGNLPQIALGTVIGSTVFMLTAGLGVTLVVVPMEIQVPKQGGFAMMASLLLFAIFLWNDGTVSRLEGLCLVVLAAGLMAWLYDSSPVFQHAREGADARSETQARIKVLGLLLVGVAAMLDLQCRPGRCPGQKRHLRRPAKGDASRGVPRGKDAGSKENDLRIGFTPMTPTGSG